MKKIQSILAVLSTLFLIFSCVTPDPAAVYGPSWNNQNPNSNNSGGNITGPRIIYKIQTSTQLFTEYTSTASGVLNKVDHYAYDGAVQVQHNITTITYNNNKISLFELAGAQGGSSAPLKYKINPTYDSSSRIISYVEEVIMGTSTTTKIMGVVNYNSSNKPVLIIEKLYTLSDPFNPNSQYVWNGGQRESLIEYSGENVIKVTHHQKTFDITNNTLLGTQTILHEHSQYDSKLSPYSTLSKDYRLLFGVLHPELLAHLSYNNPLKMKITYPMAPVIETNITYNYDAQNYAISEVGGRDFIYKAIQ